MLAAADRSSSPAASGGLSLDERQRLALDGSQLGIWDVQLASGVLTLDARCKTLLGIALQEIPDREAVLQCLHVEDRERAWQTLTRPWRLDGEAFAGEFRRAMGNGDAPSWIGIRGKTHRDVAGQGARVVGTMEDVSGRRQADSAREVRFGELAKTVRFSEMFIGILAHDLRNPLGAILTNAQAALRQEAAGETTTSSVGRILSSGQRIRRMIDQLLDFTCARIGGGIPLHPLAVDMTEVAEQVVAELKVTHPRWAMDVQTSGDSKGNWDGDRVAQVLSNLVANALQHGVPSDGLSVRIDGDDPENVMVSVHNRGTIPPHLFPILFNPFRGTREKREGSSGLGLGLYVTRQIALAHGGDVDFTSTDDEGTTFVVQLPRVVPPPDVQRPSIASNREEMQALERFAGAAASTNVTAQLFGALPLHERSPRAYWQLFERYTKLLDRALQRGTHRETPADLAEVATELRAVADRLGSLHGGAREVAELHARALRQMTKSSPAAKTQALIAEGRLLAFELMGHLLSYYRRRVAFGSAAEDKVKE